MDQRHSNLRANLQRCFEETTGFVADGISILEQAPIPINTVTGKPSGNGFFTYTVEIQVPTNNCKMERDEEKGGEPSRRVAAAIEAVGRGFAE